MNRFLTQKLSAGHFCYATRRRHYIDSALLAKENINKYKNLNFVGESLNGLENWTYI